MTVTLAHLRSLTEGASSGAEALGMLFSNREFHPNIGRRQGAADAICGLIEAYLTLKPREVVELALVNTVGTTPQAVTIGGGRGDASRLFASVIAQFTTDQSSVPMLGFDHDIVAPFWATHGQVGDKVCDAWWITITADTLSISGRTIWDREV